MSYLSEAAKLRDAFEKEQLAISRKRALKRQQALYGVWSVLHLMMLACYLVVLGLFTFAMVYGILMLWWWLT